ncbi:MAG: Gfo/Idh/MocA family oxidoreductase [Bacteroidota bacterium]|nr:Gfo/Idh/MocA family oxidoreductase [Bacteroidota bacterium]
MKHGFGIIGAGGIAEVHASAIDTIMDVSLVGVYDLDPVRAVTLARQYKCRAFGSIEELCNDSKIDIVCVCTPSGEHLEPSLAVINAGKNCIIEKPLEISLSRCDRIINAGIQNGVTVAGIFPIRYSRVNIDLKAAIDEGRFGNLVMGDAYIKWHRNPEYYSEVRWRSVMELSGGGALMSQGIHSVDLLQWFMGKLEAVSAFCGLLGHKNIEVEDSVVASLRFSNSALGVIEASTAINPGFYRRMEILGTRGSVITEEENVAVWKFDEEKDDDRKIREKYSGEHRSGGGVSDPKAISDVGHLRQILDIIKSIDNGHLPAIDSIEARKAVEIVLAIYESARKNKVVYL